MGRAGRWQQPVGEAEDQVCIQGVRECGHKAWCRHRIEAGLPGQTEDPHRLRGAVDAWLDAAPVEPAEVDEDALAAALAEDELGDVTPEELAGLEAGLVLGDDPDSLDDDGGQVR